MVQVTIQINAPDHALDQELLTLELASTATVGDLKSTVSANTDFPSDKLQFYLNGQPVAGDDKTLDGAGIKNGEMLAMLVREDMPPSRPQQQPGRGQPRPAGPMDASPEGIETLRLRMLGDAATHRRIAQQDPEMAQAVSDPARFREVFQARVQQEEDRERERREQMELLNQDPFNAEAQAKIEEIIRQERVMENLQYAYEHTPEVFGRVSMLYVNTEVNGRNVKAFVDSGAQTTIMSPSCAEACGIMRLIDKRFSGVARGVGTAQIIGRVHSAGIKIGNQVMPCSFTVMEGKDVDLLLGLDMLKRYQASIDLKRNKLVFENNEVDFLPESELPKSFQENEPTIQGPGGVAIGAQSGAPKPPTSPPAAQSGSSSSNFQGSGRSIGAGPSGHSGSVMPSASAAPSQKVAASWPEESVAQLVNLGFTRDQAVSALDATNGEVEYAAGLLFQS